MIRGQHGMLNMNSHNDDDGDGHFGLGYNTHQHVPAPDGNGEQSGTCFVVDSSTIASNSFGGREEPLTSPASITTDQGAVSPETQSHETDEQQNERLALGKARAMAALARIRQPPPASVSSEHLEIDSNIAEKRRIGFLRENERKRLAIQKNLEYLAAKDQQKIVLLDQQANQVAALETQARIQYQHHLNERESRLKGVSIKAKSKPRSKTATIYISGMLVNSSDCDDSVISKLFAVFGSIRKVHFYRDRQTEALKGDGLVVYDVASGEAPATLIETVCSQLDGAELPGGSILHVEPAHEGDSKKHAKKPEVVQETKQEASASTNINDLDAFFGSL